MNSPFSDTIRSAIMDTFKSLMAARFPQISPEFALKMEESVAEELGIEIDYKVVEARMKKEREAMEAMGNEPLDDGDEEGKKKAPKKGPKEPGRPAKGTIGGHDSDAEVGTRELGQEEECPDDAHSQSLVGCFYQHE